MLGCFENDAFARVFKAFDALYPDKQFTCVWARTQTDESGQHDVWGATTFFDDGRIPMIAVDDRLMVADAVEILAHELAHVAVGVNAEHNHEWEAAFELIYQEYCRILQEEAISHEIQDDLC